MIRTSARWKKVIASRPLCVSCAIQFVIVGLCLSGQERSQAKSSVKSDADSATLAQLLDVARGELRAAKVPKKEIRLRLRIIEDVATVKAYFPHADGGRPEMRNPKYWAQNEEGAFIPRDSPSESIKDLWQTTSGIRCRKLSTLVMLKALIDVSDSKQLGELDEALRGKVIPNDLPNDGIGTFFEKLQPRHGQKFSNDEFLAGDEVWFDNPYFEQLSKKMQPKYYGQEGHHVFYVGGGKVMDMYGREAEPIEEFRKSFLHWGSVKIATEGKERAAKPEDFQIKAVRRVIVDGRM